MNNTFNVHIQTNVQQSTVALDVCIMQCVLLSSTHCLFLQSCSTGAHADLLPPLPPSARAPHAPQHPHHHHHHHHHHHRSNLSVCVLPQAMVQSAGLCVPLVSLCGTHSNLCCVFVCLLKKKVMFL